MTRETLITTIERRFKEVCSAATSNVVRSTNLDIRYSGMAAAFAESLELVKLLPEKRKRKKRSKPPADSGFNQEPSQDGAWVSDPPTGP